MRTDTEMAFQVEIGAEERVLWSGQPKQGLMLRPSDAIMIPLSLLWGGFALFWEFSVAMEGSPFFFILWGMPFVLAGLYMIAGRFFVDAIQRKNTYYALTNERVIILSGLLGRNVKTLNLKTLQEINLNLRGNGSGTITFGPSHPLASWYAGRTWPGSSRYSPPSLEMIENARDVYELIRRVQREL